MMSNSRSEVAMPGGSPRLEEWALISKAKALEHERMKEMETMEKYNKMIKFKQDLDAQISQKGNTSDIETQRDREYYDNIMRKGNEQRMREQREKMERLHKRKQMEEENRMIIEDTVRSSRSHSQQNEYNLHIGVKSELMQKQREEEGKREMMATLEQQLRSKREQTERQKIEELYQDMRHNRMQSQIFEHKPLAKKYEQNRAVYENYQKILDEKKREEELLHRKFVDEAADQRKRQEQMRKSVERRRREDLASDMKETLEQQVRIHNYKKHSERQVNPEDVSFHFISDLYREHPPAYDKQQYQQELRKQAQEQRNKKKSLDFMSEEEYKLNINQLNKIVTGNYAHDKYVDRSLGAIGERKPDNRKLLEKEDENAEFVRNRLEGLRNRRSAGIYSRMENSSFM